MNKIVFFVFVSVLFLSCAGENPEKKVNQKPDPVEAVPIKSPNPLLRHVVLFKFKDGAALEDIQKVENAFRDLPNHIEEIVDFEWGTNNSPEELEQGFTHCFFVSFLNETGRAVYLPHPKHIEFVEILKPTLDKVLVFDYFAKE